MDGGNAGIVSLFSKQLIHSLNKCKGRTNWLPGLIDESVGAKTGGQESVAFENLVVEPYAQSGFFFEGGDNRKRVVVQSGPVVFDLNLNDR